jgi:plasmid stabilization system protein ParE
LAYKTLFTEDALANLEIILDYIRSDIKLLQDFPRLGEPLAARPAVRKILHSPIRLYYRIHEQGRLIEILHLWHAARKPPQLL